MERKQDCCVVVGQKRRHKKTNVLYVLLTSCCIWKWSNRKKTHAFIVLAATIVQIQTTPHNNCCVELVVVVVGCLREILHSFTLPTANKSLCASSDSQESEKNSDERLTRKRRCSRSYCWEIAGFFSSSPSARATHSLTLTSIESERGPDCVRG